MGVDVIISPLRLSGRVESTAVDDVEIESAGESEIDELVCRVVVLKIMRHHAGRFRGGHKVQKEALQ